jgi:hypothetical protein
MTKGSKRTETVFLRPELNDTAKRYITDYLNSEPRDDGKVLMALKKLQHFADRVAINDYAGQVQVSAFFNSEDTGKVFAVGGLGVALDLAILSCFAKCEFVYDWQFVDVDATGNVSDKPQFS